MPSTRQQLMVNIRSVSLQKMINANQALVSGLLPVLVVHAHPQYISNFMEATLKQKLMRMRSRSSLT